MHDLCTQKKDNKAVLRYVGICRGSLMGLLFGTTDICGKILANHKIKNYRRSIL